MICIYMYIYIIYIYIYTCICISERVVNICKHDMISIITYYVTYLCCELDNFTLPCGYVKTGTHQISSLFAAVW